MRFFFRMLFGIYPQAWYVLAGLLLLLRVLHFPLLGRLPWNFTLLACLGMALAGYLGVRANRPRY